LRGLELGPPLDCGRYQALRSVEDKDTRGAGGRSDVGRSFDAELSVVGADQATVTIIWRLSKVREAWRR
jgi:hypothetical protein